MQDLRCTGYEQMETKAVAAHPLAAELGGGLVARQHRQHRRQQVLDQQQPLRRLRRMQGMSHTAQMLQEGGAAEPLKQRSCLVWTQGCIGSEASLVGARM